LAQGALAEAGVWVWAEAGAWAWAKEWVWAEVVDAGNKQGNKMSSGPIGLKMKKELAARGIKVIGDVPNDPLVAETSWEGSVLLSGMAFEAAGTVLDGLLSGIADLLIRDRQL
jgi:hypothetical protein